MEPKTKSSYKSRIESFIEFVHDKPVHQVERKDIHNWLLHVLNVEKRARKTVTDGYLPALKSLFNYGLSSGKFRMVGNPTDGAKVPQLTKGQEKSRARPRFPFPTTYANLIFASDWYAGNSNKLSFSSKTFASGGAWYWIPLIFMSHGFRPEEICQMTLHDVGVQGGALAIQVTDEGDKQVVKNEFSKRWVPVHKLLVELGFAEYVAEQRKRQKVGEPGDTFRDRMPNQDADAPRNAGRLFPKSQVILTARQTHFPTCSTDLYTTSSSSNRRTSCIPSDTCGKTESGRQWQLTHKTASLGLQVWRRVLAVARQLKRKKGQRLPMGDIFDRIR